MKPFIYIFFCTFLFSITASGADEIHSVNILLDVSKSVSPQQFERIKGQIQEITQQKESPLHITLYIFGNNLQKISLDQLRSVEATQSNTIFYDALYDVLQALEKGTSGKKSIVIFSDGKDTRSATILNDTVSFAREEKIVIHCVGIGKANQRLLERLAKLTGGKYFAAEDPALVQEILNTVAVQLVAPKAAAPIVTQPRGNALPVSPSIKERSQSKRLYGWMAAFVILLVVGGGVVLYRLRSRKRNCATCGKSLQPSQLICPDCPGQTRIQPRPEIPEPQPEPLPAVSQRRIQSNQETQELLSKTYFLDETPALVVTKGKNVGEKFRLSKDHPVSIGRSRLNEIRPDDPSISAQHCRIIPENGEYVVYDLGSTNGTVVNNINVNMAVLEEGDTIRIGSITLLFTLAGS
jgi:hypothetical protein